MAERAPGLFAEGVRAALEAWPALQVALENGFGGAYGKQKADWMVTAVEQYFYDNADLESEEVEELLADILDNEFDTVVEDGSLSEVAHQIWTTFTLCQSGQASEVRARIQQLVDKKRNVRVEVMPGKGSSEEAGDEEEDTDEEEEDGAEAMDCDSQLAPGPSSLRQAAAERESDEEAPDGWTVVRRRRK
ncbi:pre-rRNA-processing protein TSR2 homolog [Pristis pectinata]|uniref:pre-rRNA-processing protein TSR2 homolog n=1 Tax=Pristis pectinata TaxID=685728 RepID=UPI00223E0E30|nr:pre-rRNA-processing protein TSR2 homolog [Pristis pectinata]